MGKATASLVLIHLSPTQSLFPSELDSRLTLCCYYHCHLLRTPVECGEGHGLLIECIEEASLVLRAYAGEVVGK